MLYTKIFSEKTSNSTSLIKIEKTQIITEIKILFTFDTYTFDTYCICRIY